jgi:Xaa-Pro aminopeptidase
MPTELLPDDRALRYARRERALAAMADADLDVLVLGRPANVRYVAGAQLLWNAGPRGFSPSCVLVRDSGEVHLLSTWDEGVPEEITHDHLYGLTWDPMNLVATLQGIAAAAAPRRVGTDAQSPLFAKLLPVAFPDAEIVDGEAALRGARRVKTAEEIAAIRHAIGITETALAAALAELRPGITERQLTGVFMDAMASQGVTTPASQDVARITSRARDDRDEQVRAGDLVAFDAGVVAGGYTGEVGRTWVAGTRGHGAAARDLFDRARALSARLVGACRPGATGDALLTAYADAGEAVPDGPVARGIGLGLDEPLVVRDLPATAAATTLVAGAVLSVTATVSERGVGTVTASEVVLVTDDAPEVLTSSPWWDDPSLPA